MKNCEVFFVVSQIHLAAAIAMHSLISLACGLAMLGLQLYFTFKEK